MPFRCAGSSDYDKGYIGIHNSVFVIGSSFESALIMCILDKICDAGFDDSGPSFIYKIYFIGGHVIADDVMAKACTAGSTYTSDVTKSEEAYIHGILHF